MDGTPEDALLQGADGYFAAEDAELLTERYRDKMCICGGLGAERTADDSPAAIYKRVGALSETTRNTGYMIGTGGEIGASYYLSLISLLGIAIRLRN